jgi:hypothetical protein
MNEFAKKCIKVALKKWLVDALFKFSKLSDTWRKLLRLSRALKPMARKEENSTNVGNKEGRFVVRRRIMFAPRMECQKLALCN